MKNEKKLRRVVRKILKEELSSNERGLLEDGVCEAVSQALDHVLVNRDVHKKGLSEQQASTLFRCILSTVDDKLEEFTSKKRPKKFSDYQEYIEKYGL